MSMLVEHPSNQISFLTLVLEVAYLYEIRFAGPLEAFLIFRYASFRFNIKIEAIQNAFGMK